jgi:hypothetical protein
MRGEPNPAAMSFCDADNVRLVLPEMNVRSALAYVGPSIVNALVGACRQGWVAAAAGSALACSQPATTQRSCASVDEIAPQVSPVLEHLSAKKPSGWPEHGTGAKGAGADGRTHAQAAGQEGWKPEHLGAHTRSRTWPGHGQAQVIRQHVIPRLGSKKLQVLRPVDVLEA